MNTQNSASHPSAKYPLILGLNPAWQTVLTFDQYETGSVNRASDSISYASGKGVNCARVLQKLGGQCTLLQCGGGDYGELHLQDLQAAGVQVHHIPLQSPTRQAITLREPQRIGQLETSNHNQSPRQSSFLCTELIGSTPQITPAEEEALLRELLSLLPNASEVVICGTFPQHLSTEFWAKWLKNCEIPVILDGVSGVECILDSKAVTLLKVNEEEILGLAGEQYSGATNDVVGTVHKAVQKVAQAYQLLECVVTRGGNSVIHYYAHQSSATFEFVEIPVPQPVQISNVIGAGDSFLAGVLQNRQTAHSESGEVNAFNFARESVKRGIATACARVEVDLPWDLKTERIEDIYRAMSSLGV